MKEDETIIDFNVRLCDIINNSFSLCEKVSEEKLARNILISFPEMFDLKFTAIEEDRDIDTIKVDELISS